MVTHMASIGLQIHDVEHFFEAVAGGLNEEVDFDQFVRGCMAMKGMATTLDLERSMYELRQFEHRFMNFEQTCMYNMDVLARLCQSISQHTDPANRRKHNCAPRNPRLGTEVSHHLPHHEYQALEGSCSTVVGRSTS